jgi:hypothetical protein
MSNIHLHIIGSNSFSKLIAELDINYIISSDDYTEPNIHDSLVRIIFAEEMQLSKIKKLFSDNIPTVFMLNNKNFLKIEVS